MKRPLETILKQDVQRIFDHFRSCFDICIVFYNAVGEALNAGLNKPDSSYCKLIQNGLYGHNVCLDLDEARRRESAEKRELICYECHAGLVEAIKPIYYERNLLGFVMIGQFRSRDSIPDRILTDWLRDRDPFDLQTAYESLPYVPEKRVEDILGLFSILVDYIVMQHMVMLRGNMVLHELVSYMETHIDEDITLSDAARLARKSPSTVSHLFTRELGKSFKQTLIELKLRKAEEYMTNEPGITVNEVAARVGYADPLHFSRIYKRHRSEAPSIFLKRGGRGK